jgi:hypothetical protein
LHVLVVNEPELTESINRLRGEWQERSGGKLSATAMTWQQLGDGTKIDADLVVFPSRYLGELCVRGLLRPVRTNVMESEEFDATDVFPLIRQELIRWGDEVVALPLGIQIIMPAVSIDDHPGLALLAEAAPDAVSDEREGVLFDPLTMQSRISERGFVDTLRQLVRTGPDKIRNGTDFVLDVPVVGFGDRLVGVTTATRNGASAFKLAAWLASGEISTQLASAADLQRPVRRSLVASPEWYSDSLTADDRSTLAKGMVRVLSGETCLMIPRIPGVDEYVAALDEAVRNAFNSEATPEVALQQAAQRWDEITHAHGRERQRLAYLKHLGIEDR